MLVTRALVGLVGRIALAACVILAAIEGGSAHEQWADGSVVPPWVKAACCGPNDVHHLTSAQVHAMTDGWHIDGIGTVVPYAQQLPSQDNDYWAFWPAWATSAKDTPPIYCFFAPAQSF